MNHIDGVIKRDVYPQKMHSCSKDIRSISFLFYKYPWYIKRNIPWMILRGYSLS